MNEELIHNFRNRLQANEPVYGIFMKSGDPAFVEAAGYAGMDFAILDMEHGPVCLEQMQNNVRAAQISGMLPVVRCASLNEHEIGSALDIGAAAVEIPQIESAKEAERAVRMAKFYPQGQRGVCRFVRAAKYAVQPKEEYFKTANDTLVILQLEGEQAARDLDQILDVEGVDVLFIGPYDLSQSLGLPGQITHPRVVSLMQEIVAKAKKKGVVLETFADTPETLRMWKKAGVQYLAYSVDVGIFSEACRNLCQEMGSHACSK